MEIALPKLWGCPIFISAQQLAVDTVETNANARACQWRYSTATECFENDVRECGGSGCVRPRSDVYSGKVELQISKRLSAESQR